MKKILFLFINIVLVIISIYAFTIYLSSEQIEKRVWKQEDYQLTLITDNYKIPVEVKKEWLENLEEGKRSTYHLTTIEDNNLKIHLEKFEDILYTHVSVDRELSLNNGKILTRIVGHPNGSYTLSTPFNIDVANHKGEIIELKGNIGSGFYDWGAVTLSFGVSATDEKISEGFNFEIDNFHLYEYVKK